MPSTPNTHLKQPCLQNKKSFKSDNLLVGLLAGAALFSMQFSGAEASDARPKFDFPENHIATPESVPAYGANHTDIYNHIDATQPEHIRQVQKWIRQPSVSAQDYGVDEMAALLRQDLTDMGFHEAEIVETDGHPGVWGFYDAGAEKTLLIYMMYDVQPVNPEDWDSPPFEAAIVELDAGKAIMGRGAINQKGPQRAFLNAVDAIIKTTGTLPVNLMIAAEGEEELGSPHYSQIVDAYEERMRQADAVLFPATGQSPDGTLSMILGVKGFLYFELEAKGGDWGGPQAAEIHGSLKAIVDSPTIRLVKAISSLVSEDGNTVLIPGFYDGIRPPTQSEQGLINKAARSRNDAQVQDVFGVSRWIDDLQGRDAIVESLYIPTLNIDGIWSGYSGPGVKTILPHIATAKMDSRLPLGQHPDHIFQLIRNQLNANGYADLEMRKLSGYPAAQTDYASPAVQAAVEVANKYATSLSIAPRTTGSAPFYQFTDRLALPMIPFGMGMGTGAHAPNEFLIIEPKDGVQVANLAEIEKAYVDLLFAFARK